jgi:hypothetical protein
MANLSIYYIVNGSAALLNFFLFLDNYNGRLVSLPSVLLFC